MCGEVCVCLYIYEVLVQTFNLPQPSECAEKRLSGCVLSPPFRPPPPPSIPSPPQVSHPHSIFPSSTLPPTALPRSPALTPHAGANFKASSLDPSIQLEVSLLPVLAREPLSWMCAPQSAPTLLWGLRRCAGGKGRWSIGKKVVRGGGRLARSSVLFNHAKVPW